MCKKIINWLLVCCIFLSSCNKSEIGIIDQNADSESVPVLLNPIFPNDALTKGENKRLNLKVDLKSLKVKIVNNIKFTQYKIFNSGSYSIVKAILKQDQKVVSICKQFYIVKENLTDNKSISYIVTMVSFDSFEDKSKYNFSYFDNKDFNGLMIFSNTTGKIFETIYYKDKERYRVDFVNKEEAIGENSIKLLLYENIVNKSFAYDPHITYICGNCGSQLLEDDFWDFTCASCGMLLNLLDPAYCIVTETIWVIYFYDQFPYPPFPGDDGDGDGGGSLPPILPPPPPPPQNPQLVLSSSSNLVTLLNPFLLTVTTVPSGIQLSNIEYYIYGNGNQSYFKLNEISVSPFQCTARSSGYWNFIAVASIGDSVLTSNSIMIEMQFPTSTDILNDPDITTYIENTWSATKNFASASGRREMGFWIYINTKPDATQSYFKEDVPDGEIITGSIGTGGSITFNAPSYVEMDPNPLLGGKYVVGLFHTHTPLTYLTEGARIVGPSPADLSSYADLPGFVYDYLGQFDIHIGGIGIIYGHKIDDPSQIYVYGSSKRSTLPN